ncbi:hypothetical protein [Cellulomonas sp. PS-H5]|uniref:hypothetical protein n=1 Tax=Cellulomonas sp. PS-H5 TaxID=2820400 RepID=UPI001C4F51C1|nr:hypothetical protein [Cellulomonas sp. PS-H5]MBW0253744.1 hypothetical protein [Cellulomonas sp. PS-H5]
MANSDLVASARELRDRHSEDGSNDDSSAYSERLKDLVQDRLVESNPDATVERTSYFNHSAIPDFVITWGSSRYPRGLYLRGSYAAIIAASDVQTNRHDDPIFMSLDEAQDFQLGGEEYSRSRIKSVVAEADATLVTDLGAFAAATAHVQTSEQAPLHSLVRQNFVRGGKGLFDGEQVEQFVSQLDGDDDRSVLDDIGAFFTESAQGEFQRAAALIDLARSTEHIESLDIAHLLRGRLTGEEVRTLLPWMLANSVAPVGAPLWRLVGSLLDLRLLESESSSLRGVDLSRLIETNLDVFVATRATAGLNVEVEDQGLEGEPVPGPRWEMVDTRLARLERSSAVRFALLGTRLKRSSSGSFSAPRWSAIKPRLADHTLARASVYGIDEVITVDSRRGRSILDYLDQVIPQGSADDYFVEDVTVRLANASAAGDERDVKVDFTSRLIVTDAAVTLGSMLELVGLLGELNPELDGDETAAPDTAELADDADGEESADA